MFAFSELVLIRRCVKWHSFRRPEIVAALAALIVSASLVPFTSTARAGGDAELISGKPIKVGTDGGVGPLAVPSLSCNPLGAARVFDGTRPDLIVASDQWHPALYVFRWISDGPDGVPVFAQPVEIGASFPEAKSSSGFVLTDGHGDIFGFWFRSGKLVVAALDKKEKKFNTVGETAVKGVQKNASCLAARLVGDDKLEVFLTESNGAPSKAPGDHRAADYYPYDGAGIWRGGLPRDGIYRFTCAWPKLPKHVEAQELLPAEKGGLYGIDGMALVWPKAATNALLIYGTKLGSMFSLPVSADPKTAATNPVPVMDPAGVSMRHPTVGTKMIVYPSANGEQTDLIAGGEGGMYYYHFTGKLGPKQQPVYDSPRAVLEESADLYGGSLVVVNVADWNGDGVLDIVAGNSCGYLLVYENRGTNEKPVFSPGKRIEAGGEPVLIQGEYRGSIQGPGESHWGYTSPCVVDWNGDGLPDIVMNDIRGMHTVYLNRGTKTEPKLALPASLRADGLAVHGTWRTRPAAGMLGDRMAYVTLDDDDQIHLWWKIDDYNLEDAGKLRLTDSSPIQANYLKAGGEGRAKFQLVDWDGDGKVDLIVGTPRHATFPNPKHGIPNKAGASVLWLRNVGSNDKPVYEPPALMLLNGKPAYFGQHECSAVATTLGGGNGLNIVVGDELGRIYFCNHQNISWKPLEPATGATEQKASSGSPVERDE